MTCKLPSFFFHGICHFFRLLSFLFPGCFVEIRVLFEEFLLVLIQVFSCLVCDIGAITEYTVVSGQSNDSLMSVIGEIRMLFHKAIDQRHHIVIAY